MVSRGEGKYAIYPIYFDKSLAKKQGRRVAKKYAVEKPNSEILSKAASSLGLHPVVEKDIAHPSRHWRHEGRILIDKKASKSELLRRISNRLL